MIPAATAATDNWFASWSRNPPLKRGGFLAFGRELRDEPAKPRTSTSMSITEMPRTYPPRVEVDARNVDLSTLHRSLRRWAKKSLDEISSYDFAHLADEELDAKLIELGRMMRKDAMYRVEYQCEVFALTGELCARVYAQRPYLVQHLGALVVCSGKIAEMATGEGKTLAALLATTWAALGGSQVHVMTANEYLSERDAVWSARLLARLGLRVGSIRDTSSLAEKQAAYAGDVVYSTAAQFGFDYLFDHLAYDTSALSGGRREWAIADEADSLLIDEARTPLIISGGASGESPRGAWAQWAKGLSESSYDIDLAEGQVWLSEVGIASAEKFAGVTNLYDHPHLATLANTALRAHVLLKKDKDYLVSGSGDEARVEIIDEGTGRILADRRWQEGLHEALEAKEGVPIRPETQVVGSITVPGYLSLYEAVGGMTGTAQAAAEEFAHLYDLEVVEVPTHRPRLRVDGHDRLFLNAHDKVAALADEIETRHATGQPILVGSPTVKDAETISEVLVGRGLAHDVLSAKEPYREADVIAQAGRLGAITVATNMAGRGVDILLGGDATKMAPSDGMDWEETCAREREEVLRVGGLCVLGTARHSSKRIDDQLRGRAGRQGEPGYSQFFVSLDDELLEAFATGMMAPLLARVAKEDGVISHKRLDALVDDAQERSESGAQKQRQTTNALDKTYAAQRSELYRFREQLLEKTWRENLEDWWRLADEYGVALNPDWPFADAQSMQRVGLDPLAVERADDASEFGEVEYAEDLAALLASDVEDFLARSSEVDDTLRDFAVRMIFAQTLDASWRYQLADLDALKEGIHLRGFAGDPIAQFSLNAGRLFDEMLTRMLAVGVKSVRVVNLSNDIAQVHDNDA